MILEKVYRCSELQFIDFRKLLKIQKKTDLFMFMTWVLDPDPFFLTSYNTLNNF